MRFEISVREQKESKSRHPRKRVSDRTLQWVLQYRQAFSSEPSVIDIGVDKAENRASKVGVIAMISQTMRFLLSARTMDVLRPRFAVM